MFVRNALKIAMLVTPERALDSRVTRLGHNTSKPFNISFQFNPFSNELYNFFGYQNLFLKTRSQ